MGSAAWELRKKQYYDKYAKACKICGATSNVQLNHIKYGDYGHEQDRDLVALCGDHHEALHLKLGVRGNMRYQTRYFLDEMIKEWDDEHEKGIVHAVEAREETIAISSPSTLERFLEKLASPIWNVINIVLWK